MQMLTTLKDVLNQKVGQSPSTTTSDCTLTIEDAINILSSARRRYVIDYLTTIDGEISVRDLSEDLADFEETDRKNTYIALYQQHLDKMADKDVIIYDKREGVVAPGPHCGVLYQIIRKIEEELD